MGGGDGGSGARRSGNLARSWGGWAGEGGWMWGGRWDRGGGLTGASRKNPAAISRRSLRRTCAVPLAVGAMLLICILRNIGLNLFLGLLRLCFELCCRGHSRQCRVLRFLRDFSFIK